MSVVEFKKFDNGKPRWSLLPWDVLLGVVHILGFGADKYGPDNWANGADWSRYYNSTMRHLTAFWMGERCDPESGRSHLLHAICGLLFLAAYEMRGIGRDDRPQVSPEPEATASEEAPTEDHSNERALYGLGPNDTLLGHAPPGERLRELYRTGRVGIARGAE